MYHFGSHRKLAPPAKTTVRFIVVVLKKNDVVGDVTVTMTMPLPPRKVSELYSGSCDEVISGINSLRLSLGSDVASNLNYSF